MTDAQTARVQVLHISFERQPQAVCLWWCEWSVPQHKGHVRRMGGVSGI